MAVSANSLLYLSRDMRGTWKALTVAQAATKEATVTKRRAILGLGEVTVGVRWDERRGSGKGG